MVFVSYDSEAFSWGPGAVLVQDTAIPGARRAVVLACSVVILSSKFLKGLPLGLGNEQSREASEKHEQRVNLEDVVEPWIGVAASSTAGPKRSNSTLA